MIDVNEIQKHLPHRYPFLLVDRVTEIELGDYIRAYKNITMNEPFFQGHFPGHPIMPGVLIIEAMAQSAGILGFKTMNKTHEDGSVYLFVGADKTRFKRQVAPGDRLDLYAKVKNSKQGIWKFECEAHVDDELVASSTILVAEREVD